MAVLLTYAISQAASGGAREMIEGITGSGSRCDDADYRTLAAQQVQYGLMEQLCRQTDGRCSGQGQSVVTCSLSLLLAILREGAETTIFYVGMAPAIANFVAAAGYRQCTADSHHSRLCSHCTECETTDCAFFKHGNRANLLSRVPLPW
jgi:hypothetical protein